MTSKKAWWLEHETLAFWEVSSAASISSRGPDARRACERIENLHAHARYASTARLRICAEGAIGAIAESSVSASTARRAAKVALAQLAQPVLGGAA